MKVTWPPTASRGPISTITGAPRRTQFQRFSAERIAFLSTSTRMGAPKAEPLSRSAARISQKASTSASSGLSRSIGTMTIWRGAIAGGRRRPSSSPWVMITPPTMRVETPQLVVWQ